MCNDSEIREIIQKVHVLAKHVWRTCYDYYNVKLKYDLALEMIFSRKGILLITQFKFSNNIKDEKVIEKTFKPGKFF